MIDKPGGNKTDETNETADAPDYEALARQYLDLWQDQFAAMAADPATMETMSKMTSAWRDATMGLLGASAFAAARSNDEDSDQGDTGTAGSTGKTGTEAADGASGGTDGDVDALARRLARLEARVAGLERGAGIQARPSRKPRKGAG